MEVPSSQQVFYLMTSSTCLSPSQFSESLPLFPSQETSTQCSIMSLILNVLLCTLEWKQRVTLCRYAVIWICALSRASSNKSKSMSCLSELACSSNFMTHADGTPSLMGIMALVPKAKLKGVFPIRTLSIIWYAQSTWWSSLAHDSLAFPCLFLISQRMVQFVTSTSLLDQGCATKVSYYEIPWSLLLKSSFDKLPSIVCDQQLWDSEMENYTSPHRISHFKFGDGGQWLSLHPFCEQSTETSRIFHYPEVGGNEPGISIPHCRKGHEMHMRVLA